MQSGRRLKYTKVIITIVPTFCTESELIKLCDIKETHRTKKTKEGQLETITSVVASYEENSVGAT